MKEKNSEKIREKILALISSEYESDAAFERAFGLPEKTVNNWRRERSASFMKMLPELSAAFGVNVSELLNIPLRRDTSELSEDELHLLHLYRKSRTISPEMRAALRETLETTIKLYVSSYAEVKNKNTGKKAKT